MTYNVFGGTLNLAQFNSTLCCTVYCICAVLSSRWGRADRPGWHHPGV